MARLIALIGMLPTAALAEPFQPPIPIPQPQSASAELWFALASVGLIVALIAVHLLVRRR